mgnify:FL=1
MIKYNSNLVICQMELLKQCDNLLRLINNSNENLFEEINKQDFPLLYSVCVNYHVYQMEQLIKKIEIIKEHIKECV